METIRDLFHALYSTEGLIEVIRAGGLLALVGIVFAETGLLVGFFLPGDSLLVTAGILASPAAIGGGLFDPYVLAACLCGAAVLGDQVNYTLGRKAGDAVYARPDGRLVKRKHLEEARDFYAKYGASAIVLARFVPFLRTFVPFVAGVARMEYGRFVRWNVLGGVGWVVGMIGLGYWLGHTSLAKRLHTVILMVVAVSLVPLVIGIAKRFISSRRRATAH